MFFPIRYGGFAIYDIRRLILPSSKLEERIFVGATRRIPAAFQVGTPWGEERPDGALWIDESEHDHCYREIRTRLRTDAAYLRRLSVQMTADVERLGTHVHECQERLVGSHSPNPAGNPEGLEPLVEACINAVAWFATNWLHPFPAVRMSIARLLGVDDVDPPMAALLSGGDSPTYIQAYLALAEVTKGSASPTAFARQWAPLYAVGDAPGVVAGPAAVARIAQESPSAPERESLEAEAQRRSSEQRRLTDCLLTRAFERDGASAADLLAAQLQFLRSVVWEEEMRHLYQQQTYAICRTWTGTVEVGS